ncbi:MAG: hypothetical protein IT331_23490 [Anaerolineae bacterium]|nr:hypothetical protein [Anaerolineae bacterium]
MIPSFRALVQELEKLNTRPERNTPAATEWLKFNDALDFLNYSKSGIIPAYVSTNDFFLYAILIPEKHLEGEYVQDILQWNFGVDSGWGYGYSFEDGKPQKILFPPLEHTATERLELGDPIFFYRSFDGFREQTNYVEISQPIAHILGIHWVPGRNAYCKLNELGDLQEIAPVHYIEPGIICAIDFDALELYMFLTDSAMIRVFDVTRSLYEGAFASNGRETANFEDHTHEIYATRTVAPQGEGNGGWMRGFQIVRRVRGDDIMMRLVRGDSAEPRQYVTFVALDFKHDSIHECSCNPDQLGNYFVESDLPFSTSPAFFRPDVLSKYKQDPDKYEFAFRQIYCRGAWSLRYDINEEGQVHAFLKDLASLPYAEQIYWKSFNEKPRAGISKRSYATDFKGEWYDDGDPLESLKHTLRKFPQATQRGKPVTIWEPYLGERSYSRLGYVVTDSTKEWQDHVMELSKLLVEGLNQSSIRELAKELNCDNSQLRSLKLLRNCLVARQIEEERVQDILSPLELLWKHRSASAAHAAKAAPRRDLKGEYRQLIADCTKSMEILGELVQNHFLDF